MFCLAHRLRASSVASLVFATIALNTPSSYAQGQSAGSAPSEEQGRPPAPGAGASPSGVRATLNERGLRVESVDGVYGFGLRAYSQAYFRALEAQANAEGQRAREHAPGFGIKSFRISLDGRITDYFSLRYQLDISHTRARTYDAYATLTPHPMLRFRVGQQRAVFGIERTQSTTAGAFLDRSYVSSIAPNRDIGLVMDLRPHESLRVELAVFNGVDDGEVFSELKDSAVELHGRVQLDLAPLLSVKGLALTFGGAFTAGQVQATRADSGAQLLRQGGYRSPSGVTFAVVDAAHAENQNGLRLRSTVFGVASYQGLLVIGEFAQNQSSVYQRFDTRFRAWNLTASWAFGGQNTFSGVRPTQSIAQGGAGALQLKLRLHGLNITDKSEVFDDARSAQKVFSVGSGLAWWLHPSVRIDADYHFSAFDQHLRNEHYLVFSLTFGL